jgi:type I restriction enzyme S subunit
VKLSEVLVERSERNTAHEYSEVFSVAKEKGVINQIEHLGRSYAAEDISNYKIVRPGDIIYTKSPTAGFPYGIIKQNKTGRTGVVSVLYAVFEPSNANLGLILDYYFSSQVNTFNYLNPLISKGAKNTININNDAFLNGSRLPLPTHDRELEKIASVLRLLDEKPQIEAQQLEDLRRIKCGILQGFFPQVLQ